MLPKKEHGNLRFEGSEQKLVHSGMKNYVYLEKFPIDFGYAFQEVVPIISRVSRVSSMIQEPN